jgi:hypothetical protein
MNLKTYEPFIKTVHATRYVTPLREGGSLPAIVEGDDDGNYVLKFRGAGQGPKVLVAELISGEIARFLGLPVPEIVFMQLDPVLGRNEPDSEIRELIKNSAGLNLALDYLPGSISFDPLVKKPIQDVPDLASCIVWLDALITNVDRTPRNTNMLVWHKHLWLIDHGASLYFHHTWTDFLEKSRTRFPAIKDHVLLPFADQIEAADAQLAPQLTREKLEEIVGLVPDEWLGDVPQFQTIEAHRAAYVDYLISRLQSPRDWAEEARDAREKL